MKKFIKKVVYRNELKYKPLPPDPGVIRLLTIQPAKRKSAALNCTLSTATLASNPSFEALSYVWGNPEDLMLMLVDNKRIAITYNLLEALEALRLHDEPRTLWVDAVCINQADDKEKSTQVRMMRRIYSNAEHVVFWLGQSTTKIPRAIGFMEETVSSDEGRYSMSELVKQMTDDTLPYWDAINDFFDRPWFTRIWICQEFAFANSRHFQYGSIVIPDALVITYIEKLAEFWPKIMSWTAEHDTLVISSSDSHSVRRFQALIHTRAFPMLNMVRLRNHAPELLPILSGLITGKEATDLRDRIYALLGFLQIEDTDPHKDLLIPDYTLTVRQVFTRTMAYLVLTKDNLDALNEVADVKSTLLELPTWVANWESKHASLIFTSEDPTQEDLLYDAGGRRRLDPDRIDLIAETLRLDGYTIDTIDNVFRLPDITDDIELVHRWLHTFSPRMEKEYPLGGNYREAFWRTIFANRFPQEFEEESGTSKIYDVKIGESIPGLCSIPPVTDDEQDDLHSSIGNSPVRDGFRLFITKGGLLGLVHNDVPDQHIIVVVLGGTSPYILEPCGMQYAFRGEW